MAIVAEKREMKVRVPREAGLARFLLGPIGKTLLTLVALVAVASVGTFTYYYQKSF